ncbi:MULTISPECIES: hypothetical protein [Pedobacter]|uniref:hypothetical protein n=1 Tax=Pedobacter TaxID=84567 RepID=UPI0022478667|nr:hypothetical protein [Pedobacter sp. MC2016-05]MCX2473532.1 hypothetical protein [Pedobacter sp. MC2016-05]
MEANTISKCSIRAETKLRNGYPNWWCFTHFSSARGPGGIQLDICEKANQPEITQDEKIYIDLDDYPGGVGVWGSLEAIYDTKRDVSEKGVHVHLRREEDSEKEVDKTYKEVYIKSSKDLFEEQRWVKIDEYVACAYTASVLFERKLKVINCRHCGKLHVDADWFAVHYHKKHFCTFCGRDFIDSEPGISNPVVALQNEFQHKMVGRTIKNVNLPLKVYQKDYPGGIQIWASNPAIIWTAKRPEEAGIHVHLFADKTPLPSSDDTYGSVEIDDIVLDPLMVRVFMVQKSFSFLTKHIISLTCPACNKDHFDVGEDAFIPHKVHKCEHCFNEFKDSTRLKGVVSNPIVSRLQKLEENLQELNKNQIS